MGMGCHLTCFPVTKTLGEPSTSLEELSPYMNMFLFSIRRQLGLTSLYMVIALQGIPTRKGLSPMPAPTSYPLKKVSCFCSFLWFSKSH